MAERTLDAIKLLTEDHDNVRRLFHDFENSGSRAFALRGRIADSIRQELEVHTGIEEEIFYPAVRTIVPDMIAEAVEEHHVVDRLLTELQRLESSDEQFMAKMTVLIENVEHHAEEEEKELFPKVKRSLDKDELMDLGDRMARMKTDLKQKMAA